MKISIGLMAFFLAFFTPETFTVPGEIADTLSHVEKTDFNQKDCALENRSFQCGERATYTVYYKLGFLWISAGEVIFSVNEKNGFYHLEAAGKTYGTFDPFYRVRDTYKSKVDKTSLLPVSAVRDIEEGSYRKYSTLKFDHQNNQIKALHGKSRDNLEKDILDMTTCTHDVLSIIYYSRNMDISGIGENDVLEMNVCLDDETYNVGMRYLGRENDKRIRKAGKFDLIKFSPQLIAGNVFKEGDEMTVWVSADRNRIPVQIESPLTVGSIRVVLNDFEGLKHPFTAKK